MWIYLDAENLLGSVGKALPNDVRMEVGLDDEEPYELEDDTGNHKRTRKRMRSIGQGSGTTGGQSVQEGTEDRSKFLEQIGSAVQALASGGVETSRPASEASDMMNAEETKVRILLALQSNPDEEVRDLAKEKLIAILRSGTFG